MEREPFITTTTTTTILIMLRGYDSEYYTIRKTIYLLYLIEKLRTLTKFGSIFEKKGVKNLFYLRIMSIHYLNSRVYH